MSLNRRDFVKLCTGTVAGLGVSQMFNPAVCEAISGSLNGERPPVLWLQGAGCTGCSVSLLNSVNPHIKDVLLKVISLEFHPTVMAWEGEPAMEHMFKIADKYDGKFFLVVEGSIPTEAEGKYCVVGEADHQEITMVEAMKELGPKAAAVLAIGTCSAYGGIPAAAGSQTGAKGVRDFFESEEIATPVVNIPGCPPHPDWIVGTVTVALDAIKKHGLADGLGEVVEILDDDGRPTPFYGENIHDNCPYLEDFDNDLLATKFTDVRGCRMELGCKGPDTMSDCYKRKWNNGMNWCVQNAVCIGCVEPDFPDGKSPFYEPA
ncbi:NiFeSe hydrogenase small subunit [Halodesulfovibrio aestuarii]|uniref:cytochrome-c3 hydrogenase n=1 Tax=Halodesulfovibrio aestuarii TaxID=126333 RepID=A0A8G2C7K2_9BACT|nr:NiFeSe hydrogenase small subunit [Halodesulfovibrio aestuarii]SHI65665.1 hydrogenase small subunit [Halodesulfovibrio aestuarii]